MFFQNYVMSPKTLTVPDSWLRGGGIPRLRVWALTLLVYPSAGGLHSSVDSDGDEDVLVLRDVDMEHRVDMLHSLSPVGGHLINLVESEFMPNSSLLFISLLPNR